jgi:secreted trypsin-like serine protease
MSSTGTRTGTSIGTRSGTQISKIVRGTADATLYTFDPKQKRAIGALIDGYGKNFCTGTLVGDNVVLTAAHCVRGVDPDIVRFAVGEDSASPAKTFEVAEIRTNPLWNTRTPEHDNALLFLRASANTYATPIPINRGPLTALVGQQVQNVGYGATDPVSSDNTRRWWTAEPVVQIDAKVVVVDGRQVSSVCKGDSGSPCIYRFPNGSLRVIGTLHGGETSCIGLDRYARTDADALWLLSGGGAVQQADTPEQQEAFYIPHVPVAQPFQAGIGWLTGVLLLGVFMGTVVGGQLGKRKLLKARRRLG